jgi:hypothetical protein
VVFGGGEGRDVVEAGHTWTLARRARGDDGAAGRRGRRLIAERRVTAGPPRAIAIGVTARRRAPSPRETTARAAAAGAAPSSSSHSPRWARPVGSQTTSSGLPEKNWRRRVMLPVKGARAAPLDRGARDPQATRPSTDRGSRPRRLLSGVHRDGPDSRETAHPARRRRIRSSYRTCRRRYQDHAARLTRVVASLEMAGDRRSVDGQAAATSGGRGEHQ